MGPAHPTRLYAGQHGACAPDLDRYPRFIEAMKVAQVAEYHPGMPSLFPETGSPRRGRRTLQYNSKVLVERIRR
jgi:hypothetical protein